MLSGSSWAPAVHTPAPTTNTPAAVVARAIHPVTFMRSSSSRAPMCKLGQVSRTAASRPWWDIAFARMLRVLPQSFAQA